MFKQIWNNKFENNIKINRENWKNNKFQTNIFKKIKKGFEPLKKLKFKAHNLKKNKNKWKEFKKKIKFTIKI